MKCHFLILCVFMKTIAAGHVSSGYLQINGQPRNPVQQNIQNFVIPVYEKPFDFLNAPNVHQGTQYVQSSPVRQQSAQNIPQSTQYVQSSPVRQSAQNVLQSTQYVQSSPVRQQSAQYVQSFPLQQQENNAISYQHYIPQDTPEVQAAKAQHLAAYRQALEMTSTVGASRRNYNQFNGQETGFQYSRPLETSQYYQGQTSLIQPANLHGFVPVDTPEVQQARAAHLEAHARARAHHSAFLGQRNRWTSETDDSNSRYSEQDINDVEYNGDNQDYYSQQQAGPVDTPEVQAARQQHLTAHQKIRSGNFGIGDYSSGIGSPHGRVFSDGLPQPPVDTPEVQAAKAQFFAAYEAELEKHRRLARTRTTLIRKETPQY